MTEKMRDAIVSELRHTAGKLINGEISDGDIAASLLSEAAELLASSPAQEPVTTEPEDIVWSRVNSEPFEYAIQQGPHGDEFVKLINGKCLKRSCAPLLAIPAPPQPGRDAVIEECAQIAESSCITRDGVKLGIGIAIKIRALGAPK